MSIDSPATYGEHYWSSQVEAAEAFEEKIEDGVKPFIPRIFADADIRAAMPFDILPKLEGLLAFPSAGLGAIGGRFVSEIADQAVATTLSPPMREVGYAANAKFPNLIMTPDTALNLFRRKRILPAMFESKMKRSGYGDIERQFLQIASAPFPGIPELMRWARYHGSPDNTWGTLFEVYDLDATDYPMWDWLSKARLTTDQVTQLWRRDNIDAAAADYKLQEIGWSIDDVEAVRGLSYVVPNAMLLIQGNLMAEASDGDIFADLGHADIHGEYRRKYLDAVLTKPASTDLIAYHLRQENELRDLNNDLRRIGIHPDYFDIYKTLAMRIPPVADIITMAVREAFSPETARRFGQYEDFPKDFGRYAAQQGLSEDWAKRYWAAHWGLPSVTQGFNMLHRGIIELDDLTLLLKAQDVMPFWREKLVRMAYKPITRVDVRRMYREGVLDETDVFEAYLAIGYSDVNAQRMTEFTVRQTLSTLAKFTTTDVVRAYTERMIDRSEANSLLRMLGVKSQDTTYILSTADYKKAWADTEERIKAIRNLYRRQEYNEDQTRSYLLRLDLPSVQVDNLMNQWWYEKAGDGVTTWSKAETFKFFKAGLINEDRAKQELTTMGYDDEHIKIYMEVAKSIPVKK